MITTRNTIPFLMASALFFAISTGINMVSLPLLLYHNANMELLIGISSAVELSAGLIIVHFLHRFSQHLSIFKLIGIFGILDILMILILPFYQNFLLWLVLIFIHGMSWFSMISLRISWINMLVTKKRNMIVAITSTVICTGLTIGPIIVKLIGAEQYLLFFISSLAIATSIIILLPIKKIQPRPKITVLEKNIFNLLRKEYVIYLSRFLIDMQTIILINFTVIYGISHGLSPENAGLLISAFMGIGLFDFLIGFLIHGRNYYRYITIGFIGCFLTIITMPWLVNNYILSILIYAVYGWFISLAFITIIIMANSRHKKSEMVVVNSILQASSSLGAMIGVLIAGFLIQSIGNIGFIISLFIVNLAYFAIRIYETHYKSSKKNQAWS